MIKEIFLNPTFPPPHYPFAAMVMLPSSKASMKDIADQLKSVFVAFNRWEGHGREITVSKTLCGEYVAELSMFYGNLPMPTRIIRPESDWGSPCTPNDLQRLCSSNSTYAIAVKQSMNWISNNWPNGKVPVHQFMVFDEHPNGLMDVRWVGNSAKIITLNPGQPPPGTAQDVATVLDDILGKLYDASRMGSRDVGQLLTMYRQLTGKDRPGFMK